MANSADPDLLASEKPTNLDLHCLQRQDIYGFSRTRVKLTERRLLLTHCSLDNPKRLIGKRCRPRSDVAEHGI